MEFKTEISFKNNWNYFNGMPNEFSKPMYINQSKFELEDVLQFHIHAFEPLARRVSSIVHQVLVNQKVQMSLHI